ncbi:MAG TPA: peptide chain release factor-like protein [Chlamydiales bacterium]|nr:peptide chain release factor-like protein [Chlamydiales bacterium]HPE84592.1 peptide chain release factor-like protein [Chlamydiales bacterium]
MVVKKEKWDALEKRMQQLDLQEDQLIERFILGSGSGGQKINKTHSCVHLKHTTSGLEVRCQKTRFRADNRYHARARLCDKLDALIHQEKSKKQQAIEKIRRQKKKRSKRSKEKMLQEKHNRSTTKQMRASPSADE